jgi:hypothetical protein
MGTHTEPIVSCTVYIEAAVGAQPPYRNLSQKGTLFRVFVAGAILVEIEKECLYHWKAGGHIPLLFNGNCSAMSGLYDFPYKPSSA